MNSLQRKRLEGKGGDIYAKFLSSNFDQIVIPIKLEINQLAAVHSKAELTAVLAALQNLFLTRRAPFPRSRAIGPTNQPHSALEDLNKHVVSKKTGANR